MRPVPSSIVAETTGTRPRNSETLAIRPIAISSFDSDVAARTISAIGRGVRQSL